MTTETIPPLVPGADAQLLHLAIGFLMVLGVGAVPSLVRRVRSGRRAIPEMEPDSTEGRRGPSFPAGPLVATVLLLPIAAVLRQFWGHPALGGRALAVLVIALVVAAVTASRPEARR